MIPWVDKFKRLISFIIIVGILGLLIACNPDENDDNGNNEPPVLTTKYINGITILSKSETNDKIEFELYENDNFHDLDVNPYDYNQFKIIGVFKTPSSETKNIHAFWYQDFELILDTNWKGTPNGISGQASTNPDEPQGLERAIPTGNPHYRLRYNTQEIGLHDLKINIYLKNKLVQTLNYEFDVIDSGNEYQGVLKVEQTHKRNLVYDNGKTFIAVGQNTSWYTSTTRQSVDYDVWFSKMNENNANFARIWMGVWNFSLHFGDSYDNFDSRQARALRLDKVFNLADEFDIHFMLTFINHGQFSASVNPQWIENPWNVRNGGILSKPYQFFTNAEAKETYKQQLIYIISRWGYSDKVIWELWNEVDWTDNYNALAVTAWHNEMTNVIKEVDAYDHLITTSYKGNTGSAYSSDNIDFANPHDYGYANVNVMEKLVPIIDSLYAKYQKPILQSEIGIGWQNGAENRNADPTGVSIKQNQWAGIMGGSLGGAMNWWWDSFVHPLDLYYRFKGAGEFAKKMDLVGENYNLLHKLSGVKINNNNTKILGYIVDDRIYGYLYDKKWTHKNTNINEKTVNVEIPFMNGKYDLEIYDTDSGELLLTTEVIISNNKFSYSFSFKEDKAFILKEK